MTTNVVAHWLEILRRSRSAVLALERFQIRWPGWPVRVVTALTVLLSFFIVTPFAFSARSETGQLIPRTYLPLVITSPRVVVPMTTLGAETGNNTSANSSFPGVPNGDIAPGNVSKVPIQSLLPAGATAKVYAHLVTWFGPAPNEYTHMDVGYSSDDPGQSQKQINDMLSRGIQGAIIDWYGTSNLFAREDIGAQAIRNVAATTNGAFTFAIMEDWGALQHCAGSTNFTSEMENDLSYVYNTYTSSAAYMRINARPAIFFGVNP